MNLRSRTLLSMVLLFLFSMLMFIITWYVSGLQNTDGLVINLAGRQRMLTQKISKEFLLIHIAKDDEQRGQLRKLLGQSIEVFERTQKALLDGGPAPLTLNPSGDQGKLPEAVGPTAEKLREANALIDQFLSYIRKKSATGEMRTNEEGALEVQLLGALNSAVGAMQTQAEDKVRLMLQAQALCVILSLLALLALVIKLRKALFHPLDKLLAFSRQVASGNLDARPDGEYIQELLILKDSLAHMVDELKQALQEASAHAELEARAKEVAVALEEAKRQEAESQRLLQALNTTDAHVARVVDSLYTASERLNSEVTGVTKGADKQSAHLREIADSMDNMCETLARMTDSASQAADNALTTEHSANDGVAVVKQTLSAADTVHSGVIDLRNGMEELGKRVDGITFVMQIITDIADQTNLLALNAAIEAARAGDAGRGFAVVADEVRKLAEKTMEATSQVRATVHAIQKDTQDNIAGVNRTAEETEEVSALAQKSASSLDTILRLTGRAAGQADSIANAAREQTAFGKSIMASLDEVNAISEKTRSGMEEAFKAIADISSETRGLHELVENMKR